MAESGYKSISRIDQVRKRTHGWYVRVYFKGTMYAKFFSDVQYGGSMEASLEEAILYRNEIEKQIGKPRSERPVVKISPCNQTGVIGVRRRQKRGGRKAAQEFYDVYEVTWCPEPGRVGRTSVSIKKYGEEEAFRRACEVRKAKEQEMYQSQ